VLADHGKFGHVGTARIAPIERVDMLVSDSGLSSEAVRALEERGPRIVLA
jgi:DeoR/GlpR family transcriptional regulator of sugar metabolism